MSPSLPITCDTLILGAGVVGLSLAYELLQREQSVVVLDRQPPGQEASWAGAGILPPGSWYNEHPALEALARQSMALNAEWSAALGELTGIANQLRAVGALHVASTPAEVEQVEARLAKWGDLGIESSALSATEAAGIEPNLAIPLGTQAYHVPAEATLHNRYHTEALRLACTLRGGIICHPVQDISLALADGHVQRVETSLGFIAPGQVAIAAGAWSGPLTAQLGCELAIRPVRGQMLQFGPFEHPPLRGVVHGGDRYLVPRADRHLIVGSTVEEVGFDKQTTGAQLEALEHFARALLPALNAHTPTDAWAGLRPASADGLPYVGRAPGVHNAYVAAGHFRAGLQMASGTAASLARLMAGETPPVDLYPFRLDR